MPPHTPSTIVLLFSGFGLIFLIRRKADLALGDFLKRDYPIFLGRRLDRWGHAVVELAREAIAVRG